MVDKWNVDKSGKFYGNLKPAFFGIISPLPTLTLSETTGTLGAGTYYYVVAATTALGETAGPLAADVESIVLAGTGGVKLDWTPKVGVTGYKVYGRSAGVQYLMTTITDPGTSTWTDNGSVTPAGASPSPIDTTSLAVMVPQTGATQFGSGAQAGERGSAFGYQAVADVDSTAFGYQASGFVNSHALGALASALDRAIAIGYSASAGTIDDSESIAIGADSSSENGGIAIGYGSSSLGGVAIGAYSAVGSGAQAVGANTISDQAYSFALGRYSKAERFTELVHSVDMVATTKNSWSMCTYTGTTTNNTPTEISLDGSKLLLLNSSAFMVTVTVVGFDDTNSCAKGWKIETAITRGANAAATAMATATSENYAVGGGTTGAWAAALSADTTFGSLKLTVTGDTGVTVKWTARANFTEVRF